MNSITLSIIIAVHNNSKTLKKCLDSFYNKVKTFKNVEIICINDHSSDSSIEIIKKYKNIRVFNSNKRGLGNSRNCGIEHSKGKFLWFIDADDEINGVELNNSFLEKLKNCKTEVILLGVEKINGKKQVFLVNKAEGIYSLHGDTSRNNSLFKDNIFNNSWNKLYKREIILKNNLKFDDVSSVEDIMFNCKFFYFVNTIYVFNRVFYKYYIYSKTSTKWHFEEDKLKVSINMINQLVKLEKRHSDFINKGLVIRIAVDTLIGNEINLYLLMDNNSSFERYKRILNKNDLEPLKKYCKGHVDDFHYYLKMTIANSPILSYLYIKRMISNKQ